jgi:hypothetical protein
MQSKQDLYLSIIVTGRNDNYGGDFYERIQNQITCLTHLAEKYQVETEYILVNYNPVDDQPTLRETLNWSDDRRFMTYRILTIPKEIHHKFVNLEVRKTIPLFEFIGKNAAIRRARGKYILTSNADIVFDPGIFKYLSKNSLSENNFYRADRCDYHGVSNAELKNTDLVKAAQKNVFTYFLKGKIYTAKPTNHFKLRLSWLRLFNFNRQLWMKSLRASPFLFKKVNDIINHFKGQPYLIQPEVYHHCNAAGDFTLLSTANFQKLKGFPEDTFISSHVDSILVFMCLALGLKEKILKAPVYHQDHARRFIVDKKEEDKDVMRQYARMRKDIETMEKNRQPLIANDDSWGLAGYDLPEDVF